MEDMELNLDTRGLQNVLNRMINRHQVDDSACLGYRNLSDKELSEMFRSDGLIQKIVKIYPQAAKSIGYIIKDKNGNIVDSNNPVLIKAFEKAHIYARIYGRSLLYLKFDDRVSDDKPVRLNSKLSGFEIKFDVYRDGDFYTFGVDKIHYTRVIEFIGVETFVKETFENDINRHDSVIQRIYKAYVDFLDSTDDAKFILKNISYLTIGIENLGAMSKSTEGQQMIFDRLTTLNINRSINRVLSFDKSKESIDFISQTLTGVENILDRAKDILVAQSDYPHEELFEKSSNQSLGSGIQNQLIARYLWAKRCRDWVIDHQLDHYYEYFSRVLPNFYESYKLIIPFIVDLTDTEKAEIEKMGADRTKILIESGVISPDEARTGYGNSEYTLNIVLNENAPRKDVLGLSDKASLKVDEDEDENNDSIPDDLFWDNLANITGGDLDNLGRDVAKEMSTT